MVVSCSDTTGPAMGSGVVCWVVTERGQSGAMLEARISEGRYRTMHSLFTCTVRSPEFVTACKNVSCCYGVGPVPFNFWLIQNSPQSSVLGVFSRLVHSPVAKPDTVHGGFDF